MACRLLAWSAGTACRFGDAADASERPSSTRDGRATSARSAAPRPPMRAPPRSARRSSTRRSRAARRALEQTAGDRQSEGNLLAVLGGLYAMQGAFDHARGLRRRARERCSRSSASRWTRLASGIEAWRVEMLAGDSRPPSASSARSYDALEALGERYVLSTVAGLLAQTLLEQGDDSTRWTSSATGAGSSRPTRTSRRRRSGARPRPVLARREARRGGGDDRGRRSSLLEPTDATVLPVDAQLDLGEVLVAGGRIDEARDGLRERARPRGEEGRRRVLAASSAGSRGSTPPRRRSSVESPVPRPVLGRCDDRPDLGLR